MTSKGKITKIADGAGVEARVVERDYVLHHVVSLVSARDTAGKLVFKGGTSLRLLHFDEYRYSADLDYSVIDLSESAARDLIRGALVTSDAIKELRLEDEGIFYVGPLGAARTIKLDLTNDELVENTERRTMVDRWSDVPKSEVLAYTKLEITAEKLRCVLQRRQCRDLLDLGVLLETEDPMAAAELFARKAKHRSLNPTTFAATFEKRIRDYKGDWNKELDEYLGDVPHFAEVERTVRRALRKASLI